MTVTQVSNKEIEENFNHFILNNDHPCIMAKSLFKMSKYIMGIYEDMNDQSALTNLISDLEQYLKHYNFDDNSFESFIAVFPNNHFNTEVDFESSLWNTLQKLHFLDIKKWDEKVSSNPEDPNFSFSLGGKAFYIVGMHPESSRIARQAPYTTLVFNLHYQFEKLRKMGTYQTVRDTIRKNDAELQGEINPVLRDFGKDSETKQYSGRNVDESWKCPFHKKAI